MNSKNLPKFKTPPLFLKNAHVQTMLTYVLGRAKHLTSSTHIVKLEDGDCLALEISTPENWEPKHETILMMPGTAGSHLSPYLVRLGSKLLRRGYQVARLNYRGVATASGLAKKISHGGSSLDVFAAIQYLQKIYPYSKLTAIGFSLSGNTLLKLAGEVSSLPLKQAIAICPPVHLSSSSTLLEQKQNRLYQNSILKTIVSIVHSPISNFAFTPPKHLSHFKTLRKLDDAFTAPACGFKDAEDYYQKASCLPLLRSIKCDCRILFAEDDPLIDCAYIKNNQISSSIETLITTHGGHMGFFQLGKKDPYWMDQLLVHWIKNQETTV